MIYLFCSNRWGNRLRIAAIVCGLSGCSGIQRVEEPTFDPRQVSAMRFEFDRRSLFGISLPGQEIAATVSSNLSQWGYRFEQEPESAYNYRLQAVVGEVEHAATPVGFSFSAGNSDPRSLDFQKSDVLSITCTLMPKEQPQNRAELSMGFPAGDYQNRSAADAERAQLITLLENDISTVCFNLLSELDVPVRQEEGVMPVGKPSWIPEIRLEIENEAQPNPDSAVDGATDSGQPTNAPNTAPKKRIIIHNQGSPVIFKFGHERK